MTKAQIVLDGDVGPLRQKLREAAAQINSFGRESSSALSDTLAPAAAFQAKLAGIATAMTSGAVAVFLRNSISMQDEMSKAAVKAGVTTEQFSGMAHAARLADVEVDDLGKTYAKLSGLLLDAQQGQKSAVETLSRLKIDPSSLSDADELLLAISDRMADMEDGAARTALAIDIFGEKLGPRLVPMLVAGRQGLQDLREEAARLGVVVDADTGRRAEEFNDTLTRLGTRMQGLSQQMAAALLPSLQAVASTLTDTGTAAGQTSVLASALRTTFEALAVLGANIVFPFRIFGLELAGIAARIQALTNGDWEGFKAISGMVKADAERARAELDDFERRVLQLGEYSPDNKAKEDRGWNPLAGTGFVPDPKKPTASPEKSQMAALEGRLAEERRVAAILDQGREYSKERELAFWRDILATVKLSSADRVAVMRKTATLEVDIARKAATDRQALDAAQTDAVEQLALGKIDMEQAAAQQLLELGQISKLQMLQLEQQYEDQRYAIARAALIQRLQLLADDPSATPAERERIQAKLEQLEQKHQQRMIELGGKVGQAGGSGGLTDIFQGAVGTTIGQMETSMSNALGGMLTQTQTWGQAMGGIFRQVGATFLNEMVFKTVAAYVAGKARQLAADLGWVQAKAGAEAAASGTTVGIKAAETTAVVGMNATQAGTAAAASVAPTPFVGPMLALAAMAAVFAAVMAMGSRKSAAAGYDIPSGTNPVTQLHEEEMVLPKHIANPLRAALAGAGASGGEAAPAAEPMVIKARSMDDLISVRDLARSMRKAKRDFVITRRDTR